MTRKSILASMVVGLVALTSSAAWAGQCRRTVPLRYGQFSGTWAYGTAVLRLSDVLRDAGLYEEGTRVVGLRVTARAHTQTPNLMCYKYSYDNALQPAPGRPDVPSGGCSQVYSQYPYAYDLNNDGGLRQLNVTVRRGGWPQGGETLPEYLFVNGAGQGDATQAEVEVITPGGYGCNGGPGPSGQLQTLLTLSGSQFYPVGGGQYAVGGLDLAGGYRQYAVGTDGYGPVSGRLYFRCRDTGHETNVALTPSYVNGQPVSVAANPCGSYASLVNVDIYLNGASYNRYASYRVLGAY